MSWKGTKAQWQKTTDEEPNFYGVAAKRNWLMRVQQNGELSTEEQEQNMNLIVAGTEMLTVLENLISLIENNEIEILDNYENNGFSEQPNKIINEIKSAIKKAHGNV
jgi:hypothetical protein